ncbi:MAG: S8 family serine peptidase [Tannerellaceae bacterium]|nr:S8 family serine peptidase [Tannerellaceae bacterium]
MKKLILLLAVLFSPLFFLQAGETYCFRVYLTDKGAAGLPDNSEAYLSQRAIERRTKHDIAITSSDLPIPPAYINTLADRGGEIITQSKWLSTVVIASTDSLIAERIEQLQIVDSVKLVWKGEREREQAESVFLNRDTSLLKPQKETTSNLYGYAEPQIKMLNGKKLHDKGYTGKNLSIAVTDAGFTNVNRMDAFRSLRLAGTKNFVSPGESIFRGDDHGTKVLSCLAACAPGIMVGTAPQATYWLLKTEDNRSEFPIEEDYWVSAIEFADSAGVDIIASSLGYFSFDVEEMNYSADLLDGKTAFISRAAHIAAEKGILVVSSAGNEGNNDWEKITFPADATHILTVGAITEEKEKSSFSSIGFTADCRVKPDLVALGSDCAVIGWSGDIQYSSGTSFSAPIIAGLTACLWEALPQLTNKELIALLQSTASQSRRPDAEKGFGIPDIYKAYKKGRRNAD